jgi:hypothetical protein
MRPRPQWGQGWRKGSDDRLKRGFQQSSFMDSAGTHPVPESNIPSLRIMKTEISLTRESGFLYIRLEKKNINGSEHVEDLPEVREPE